MTMPFSDSFNSSKESLLKVFKEVVRNHHERLLEIGAGSGQHAIYLAPFFPHLEWTATEQIEMLPALNRSIQESRIPNLRPPHKLQVGMDEFANFTYDMIYTANTFHVMHWKECKTLMKMVSGRLQENGKVLIYGPFNYEGKFTSPSNEELDQSLRAKDPLSGIRSFEDVNKAMAKQGFELTKDYEMSESSHLLVYSRLKFVSTKKNSSKIPKPAVRGN